MMYRFVGVQRSPKYFRHYLAVLKDTSFGLVVHHLVKPQPVPGDSYYYVSMHGGSYSAGPGMMGLPCWSDTTSFPNQPQLTQSDFYRASAATLESQLTNNRIRRCAFQPANANQLHLHRRKGQRATDTFHTIQGT